MLASAAGQTRFEMDQLIDEARLMEWEATRNLYLFPPPRDTSNAL